MIYKIPIIWESYKIYEVEAEDLQEAVQNTLRIFLREPDENYLQDSVDIDSIVESDYPNEQYDIHKALQQL